MNKKLVWVVACLKGGKVGFWVYYSKGSEDVWDCAAVLLVNFPKLISWQIIQKHPLNSLSIPCVYIKSLSIDLKHNIVYSHRRIRPIVQKTRLQHRGSSRNAYLKNSTDAEEGCWAPKLIHKSWILDKLWSWVPCIWCIVSNTPYLLTRRIEHVESIRCKIWSSLPGWEKD